MMTPKQFQAALQAFAAEVGKECIVSSYISSNGYLYGDDDKGALQCSCNPRGYGDHGRDTLNFKVAADTFDEVLTKLRAKWAELDVDRTQKMTRRLALAIIRITYEHGQCTDAALRSEFKPDEIARYGGDACTAANSMAERGPFAIAPVQGANGAPDHVETDDQLRAVH